MEWTNILTDVCEHAARCLYKNLLLTTTGVHSETLDTVGLSEFHKRQVLLITGVLSSAGPSERTKAGDPPHRVTASASMAESMMGVGQW